MEPSRCSVLVVNHACEEKTYRQSAESIHPKNFLQPYKTSEKTGCDRCTCDSNQDIKDLVYTLLKIFAEVITFPSGTEAIKTLKNKKLSGFPTFLLIDIDRPTISRESGRRESFVAIDGVSLSTFKSTTNDPLYGIDLLKAVTQEMAKGELDQVVPIIYSKCDSSELMLECLSMGAADYLIKPIKQEVAKTLFLSFHRLYPSDNRLLSIDYPIQQQSSYFDRPHQVLVKNSRLTEAIVEHYTPLKSSISLTYSPSLNSAAMLERTNFLKRKLMQWDFNPHELSEDEQLRCVAIIFEHVIELDELRDLNISLDKLHDFLLAIRQSYHDENPYHNFAHALDVLQAMFFFLMKMGLIQQFFAKRRSNRNGNQQRRRASDLLRPTDVFGLLLASIGHDVGHPGVNNVFLINSQTPLAQLYNDRSVLENFHAMTLFHMMQKHGFNIFDGPIYSCKYAEFRQIVVNAILATDMGLHHEYVAKIKETTRSLKGMSLASNEEQGRMAVIGALIKCADISNAARPYHIAEKWSKVLLEEFACQGDLEKKLNLPVGPNNDRDSVSQADSQINFIDMFALPLFQSVKELIPEMEYCIKYIESNRKEWRRMTEYESNGHPTRHNSGMDSGVSLDSQQSSPIVTAPVARTVQRQPSATSYLRPMSRLPDGPSSITLSDDKSMAPASDAPLTSAGCPKSRLKWPNFFSEIRRHPSANPNYDKEDGSGFSCCCIQ